MKKKIVLSILCVLFLCQYSHASVLDLLKDTVNTATATKSSSGKLDLGLKEALNVGIKNTINYLGKNDGYFSNAAVKILLPEKVRKLEPALRGIGDGPQIDEFTPSMNRAAEKAAAGRRIFFPQVYGKPVLTTLIKFCAEEIRPPLIISRKKHMTNCSQNFSRQCAKQ